MTMFVKISRFSKRLADKIGEFWDKYSVPCWNSLFLVFGLFLWWWVNHHLGSGVDSRLRVQEGMLRRQSEILLKQAKVALEGLAGRSKILLPDDPTTEQEFKIACAILKGVGVDKLSIVKFSDDPVRRKAFLIIMCPRGAEISTDDVTDQGHIQEILRTGEFASSGVFKPVDKEIDDAVALAAPVKDADGKLLGAVTALVHLVKFEEFLVGEDSQNLKKLRLIIDGKSVPEIAGSASFFLPIEPLSEPLYFLNHSWTVALREPRPSVSWIWIVGWILGVHVFGTLLVHRRWKTVIRFNRLVDTIEAIVFISKPDRTIVYANDYAVQRLGYSREELIGSNGKQLVASEHQEKVDQVFGQVGDQKYVRLTNKNICKDGREIEVDWSSCAISNWLGRETMTMSVGFNVTERDQILNNIPVPVMITNEIGEILFANDESGRYFGEKVMVGKNFIHEVYHEDRVEISDKMVKLEVDQVDILKTSNIKANGEVITMTWRTCRLIRTRGADSRILSIGIDDTVADRYGTIVEFMEAAVYVTDCNRKVKYVNPYAVKLFGLEGDPLAYSLKDVIHKEDYSRVMNFLEKLEEGKEKTIQNRNENQKRDAVYHMNWTSQLIDPKNPKTSDLMSVGFDVTDRVTFFTGIHHDTVAPLDNVEKWTYELEESGLVGDGIVRHDYHSSKVLEIIRKNSSFVSYMLKDLIAVMGDPHGSGVSLYKQHFSSESWVKTIKDLLSFKMENLSVVIKHEIDPEVKNVWGDKDRCILILLNLTKNALTALSKIDESEKQIRIWIHRAEQFYRIEVRDNGVGMDDDNQEKVRRLIEKGERKGVSSQSIGLQTKSGWGLPIAIEHIRAQGGEIGFQSIFKDQGTKIQSGSTFWFTLPIDDQNYSRRLGGPWNIVLIGDGGTQLTQARDRLGYFNDIIWEGEYLAQIRSDHPNLVPDLVSVYLSEKTQPTARVAQFYRHWSKDAPLLALANDLKIFEQAKDSGWDAVVKIPMDSRLFNQEISRMMNQSFPIE